MRKAIVHAGLGALALAALLAARPLAYAETINLRASLKGSEQVPPNASKGAGTLQGTYDTSSKRLSYTVEYSGLTGAATGAHFHGPASAGENAGVVVPAPSTASPIKGDATLTDAQASDLLAGKWYFNIHTEANRGGEIRGQVVKGM